MNARAQFPSHFSQSNVACRITSFLLTLLWVLRAASLPPDLHDLVLKVVGLVRSRRVRSLGMIGIGSFTQQRPGMTAERHDCTGRGAIERVSAGRTQ